MASLRVLHPKVYPLAQAFVNALSRAGIRVTVTSTRRDLDEQGRLYSCYIRTGCSNCRRGPGCFPAAAPGKSTHALGLAFDLHLDPPRYAEAGRLWESLGMTWGGRFGDPIHFDVRSHA